MQLTFGSGEVFAQMITDAYGNRVQNATPVRIMGLQEMSVDLSAELKEFYGQNRYPLAVAQGKVKVSGKMKGALINGLTLNTLFFGTEYATGTMKALWAETTGKVLDGDNYSYLQAAAPGGGKFAEDAGVMGQDGTAYIKVASSRNKANIRFRNRAFTPLTARIKAKPFIRALPIRKRCPRRRKSS